MKIKKVYLGRKQIYPDGWNPGENTIIYYEFENSLTDLSGNNNNPISYTGLTYDTVGGQGVIKNTGACEIQLPSTAGNNLSQFTISFWVNPSSKNGYVMLFGSFNVSESTSFAGPTIFWNVNGASSITYRMRGSNEKIFGSLQPGTRGYITFTRGEGGLCKAYLNGVKLGERTDTTTRNANSFYIFSRRSSYANLQNFTTAGAMGDKYIYESKARTEQEISNYFNQTKSNYGL